MPQRSPAFYGSYLLFIAGMGGLLYGIDVGIIAAALLFLGKTISLSLTQTSLIVAAVTGGSMFGSLVAGALADWFGRKAMMIVSAVLFIVSVVLIVVSHGFVVLFAGRLLQGISGGVIAVVVPLYLAECLPASNRGKGSAIFQFLLTVGIVIASATGWYFTRQAGIAIAAAHGNAAAILAAENHAWRGMFLSVIYPGIVFFAGSFFLSESPRWLFRRRRSEDALRALRRASSEEDALLEMHEMQTITAEGKQAKGAGGSLLQRKYVIPFVLACIILACNQTTGINSVLAYLVIILKQAGMTARHATQGDLVVKLLNCVMTVVAIALVDRRGRKFLLVLGTTGIIIALTTGALLFHSFETDRVSVKSQIQSHIQNNAVDLPLTQLPAQSAHPNAPMALTVLYSYGQGEQAANILTTDTEPILRLQPSSAPHPKPLQIRAASYGPVPSQKTGWFIAACIALFIASFAVGPGVVVWLTLSELMPTRIRSSGMGIALVLNQGVSTAIQGVFLPVVSHYGYATMFGFWAACTVIYFITAAFFLPETKGKTLEEIELSFAQGSSSTEGASS
ncbi:MAG TPA: MFS transporter [Acidobacteriaceae bacterium]|nr:MFS transporter [Acidobacteriaceae bacterium]